MKVGDRFAGYQITGWLGEGGMAEVFLALKLGAQGFSKEVALKCMQTRIALDPEGLVRFVEEAKLAAALTHPNIVQVHELSHVDDRYFIAMEYVPGTTLGALRDRLWETGVTFPVPEALAIFAAVLEGLSYAHDKRASDGTPLAIVHRDVSPENILLSPEGAVKLADFGIAKAASHTSRTRTGEVRGKFAYMSPEQALSRAVDRRSDIFAVGIIAHELFSARRFYEAKSEITLLELAQRGEHPLLQQVSPALAAVVQRALSFAPADRFASADDFRAALLASGKRVASRAELGAFIAAHTGERRDPHHTQAPRAVTERTPEARPATPHTRRISSVIALAAMALGVVVVIRVRHEPPPPLPAPASLPASVPVTASKPQRVVPPGFLTLNSFPWSIATIDGVTQGKTPLSHVALAAGEHHVHLVCPANGRSQDFQVVIAPGTTVTKLISFAK